MEDQQAKVREENESGAEAIAPKLVQSMQGIVQEFAQVIEGQQKFQSALIEQLKKPKNITAKSSSGATISATVQ